MDVIPSSVKWQHDVLYSDNVPIFLQKPAERVARVRSILNPFRDGDVALVLKKREFL